MGDMKSLSSKRKRGNDGGGEAEEEGPPQPHAVAAATVPPQGQREVPQWIQDLVQKHDGGQLRFVMEKMISASDVDKQQNRLRVVNSAVNTVIRRMLDDDEKTASNLTDPTPKKTCKKVKLEEVSYTWTKLVRDDYDDVDEKAKGSKKAMVVDDNNGDGNIVDMKGKKVMVEEEEGEEASTNSTYKVTHHDGMISNAKVVKMEEGEASTSSKVVEINDGKIKVEAPKSSGSGGAGGRLDVKMYNRAGWRFFLTLGHWDSSCGTVINGAEWMKFVILSGLRAGDEVELWAFREGQERKLCFLLAKKKPKLKKKNN